MSDQQEEKQYMSLAEVADFVGVKRSSLYFYTKRLGIKTVRFNLDKRAYMTRTDAERIKKIKDEPWTAGERNSSEESVA